MPRPRRRLDNAPLIFPDSSVYIDLVTENRTPHKDTGEERWKSAKELFDAVNSNRVRLAASALVQAEVCCNGEVRLGAERVRKLLDGWFTAPSTIWTDLDRFVAREAARLADEHADKRENRKRTFAGGDATHLAAAIRLGCGYLMTHDEGFPIGHTIEGVEVLRPRQVWTPQLFDEAAGA